MRGSVHGRARSFLLLFMVLGDTYPQKHTLGRELKHWKNVVLLRSFVRPKNRPRSKVVKKVKIWKVLRMGLAIVESLSGLQESIFSLSRGPPTPFLEKIRKISNYIRFIDYLLFPLFGAPWAAVIFLFGA